MNQSNVNKPKVKMEVHFHVWLLVGLFAGPTLGFLLSLFGISDSFWVLGAVVFVWGGALLLWIPAFIHVLHNCTRKDALLAFSYPFLSVLLFMVLGFLFAAELPAVV